MPDVGLIGKTDDTTHLGRLLQLMLGVAVNCPGKHSKLDKYLLIALMDRTMRGLVITKLKSLKII